MNAIDAFLDEFRAAVPRAAEDLDIMRDWFAEQDPDILDAVGKVLAQHRRCGVVERLDLMHQEVHRLAKRGAHWGEKVN
jgi:hypothetical protein